MLFKRRINLELKDQINLQSIVNSCDDSSVFDWTSKLAQFERN